MWFQDFPMCSAWFSHGFPLDFPWSAYCFRIVLYGGFRRMFDGFHWFLYGFPKYFLWFHLYGFPMMCLVFSYGFSAVSQCDQNRYQTDAHLKVLAARATCGPFRVDCFPNVSIGFPVVAVLFFYGVSMYFRFVIVSVIMVFYGIPMIHVCFFRGFRVFLIVPHGFHLVFPWISYGWLIVSELFCMAVSYVCSMVFYGFCTVFLIFTMVSVWFPYDVPFLFIWFFYGTTM